jgi:acyl carrier protein
METAMQIRNYLEEKYSSTHKGIRVNGNTLLLEEKVIDSVGVLELLFFVEETFSIEVPEEDISPDHFGTISKLALYIDSKKRQPVS